MEDDYGNDYGDYRPSQRRSKVTLFSKLLDDFVSEGYKKLRTREFDGFSRRERYWYQNDVEHSAIQLSDWPSLHRVLNLYLDLTKNNEVWEGQLSPIEKENCAMMVRIDLRNLKDSNYDNFDVFTSWDDFSDLLGGQVLMWNNLVYVDKKFIHDIDATEYKPCPVDFEFLVQEKDSYLPYMVAHPLLSLMNEDPIEREIAEGYSVPVYSTLAENGLISRKELRVWVNANVPQIISVARKYTIHLTNRDGTNQLKYDLRSRGGPKVVTNLRPGEIPQDAQKRMLVYLDQRLSVFRHQRKLNLLLKGPPNPEFAETFSFSSVNGRVFLMSSQPFIRRVDIKLRNMVGDSTFYLSELKDGQFSSEFRSNNNDPQNFDVLGEVDLSKFMSDVHYHLNGSVILFSRSVPGFDGPNSYSNVEVLGERRIFVENVEVAFVSSANHYVSNLLPSAFWIYPRRNLIVFEVSTNNYVYLYLSISKTQMYEFPILLATYYANLSSLIVDFRKIRRYKFRHKIFYRGIYRPSC